MQLSGHNYLTHTIAASSATEYQSRQHYLYFEKVNFVQNINMLVICLKSQLENLRLCNTENNVD